MILVAGATGQLGSRIVRRLRARGTEVRTLVRPGRDAAALEELGASIVRGDLREAETAGRVCEGIDTVVTGVTVMTRLLESEKTSFDAVDARGNIALVEAAERTGVRRFVFVSVAGLETAPANPLVRAKRVVEARLKGSPLRTVIVRPAAFEEVWLSPLGQLDWERGRLNVLGRGNMPQRYVSVDDVAELVAALATEDDPPSLVEFGGPEALTPNEACDLIEQLAGRAMRRRHLPPLALTLLSHALAPVRPALATIFSLGLAGDRTPATWDDTPLRERGIHPLAATEYLRAHVRAHGSPA